MSVGEQGQKWSERYRIEGRQCKVCQRWSYLKGVHEENESVTKIIEEKMMENKLILKKKKTKMK